MNHNKRFHAAFEQTEKGLKRKSTEMNPYGVPLLKQLKQRGEKRKYQENSHSDGYQTYTVKNNQRRLCVNEKGKK